MPFTGVSEMDLKREFVELFQQEGANRSQLCDRYGVSRTLGYRTHERFLAEGKDGLAPKSRRPHSSPNATPPEIEAAVLAVRAEHPAWGGRKIEAVLRRRGLASPKPSTITQIIRRHGLPVGAFGGGQIHYKRFEHPEPNDLWQMDFKGHVALRSKERLHPLTVLDDHSRFNLVLAACADERTGTVKAHLTQAFRRYGLPWRITADNGPPWGNGPRDRFTPLGVWLIDLGVAIGHSRPYHPQTQGKDERFHRSLKAEALSGPPFDDLAHAARQLERWRDVYNTERPHQALGMATPIERYRPSSRPFPETIAPFQYQDDQAEPRKVCPAGRFSFKNRTFKAPRAFRRRTIALKPTTTDGVYDLIYRTAHIASIDLRRSMDQTQPVTDVPERLSPISPV
ncbi:IS481 family transposase [Caulobacter ginsengisoli]|uniref:IS481 family transposase n=1 Tax=Caulobacter ginsengisoli TaxID=400775 RepID=UPI0027D7F297|nr:IS481 family transposase [Caulobacter ginsengisoli]